MKTLSMLLGIFLATAVFGALVAGSYAGVKLLMNVLGAFDVQTAVTTVIAMVTAFLCGVMIRQAVAGIAEKETNVYSHLEKAHLYEKLLLLWGQKLTAQMTLVDRAVEDELRQLAQLLTLRGSAKVIHAYVELDALERKLGFHNREMPSRLVALQLEMRKDLGLPAHNLKAPDLLRLFVADATIAAEPGKPAQPKDLQPRVSLAANS